MRSHSIEASGLLLTALLAGCSGPPDDGGDALAAPLPIFAKSFDGAAPRALASGPDGSLFVGGSFNTAVDFGGGVHTTDAGSGVFVAQLDARGEHLWSGSTGSNDSLWGVAVGPQGHLHAAGAFDGSINFGSGKLVGEDDAYLAAFAPGGASDHSFSVGGQAIDRFESVAATPWGGVVLTGRFGNDADLGGGAAPAFTQWQPVVVAYDGDGEHLWELRLSAELGNEFGLAVDGEGNVFASGLSYGPISAGGPGSPQGAFVMKLRPDGEQVWLRATTGDGAWPTVTTSAVDGAGNVYVGGLFTEAFSFGDVQVSPAGELNGYVARLSPDGDVVFVKTFAVLDFGSAPEVAVTPEGEMIVGMSAYGGVDFGDGPIGSLDTYDVLLARFDGEGALARTLTLEGNSTERLFGLTVGPDGAPVVMGDFDSLLDIGDTRLLAEGGGRDLFLARLAF